MKAFPQKLFELKMTTFTFNIYSRAIERFLPFRPEPNGWYSAARAFSVSSDDSRSLFQKRVVTFLESKNYAESADRARIIYSSMLNVHDKCQVLAPVIETLNIDELYEDFEYTKRRKHYYHQANVFLLGLYIYYNLDCLRDNLALEMDRTTPVIETRYFPFKYSGGSQYGEFLYRWRLASLCHDIGTGIQLSGNVKKKIEDILTSLLGGVPRTSTLFFCFKTPICLQS
jgi:hypothetical protein